MPFVLQSWIEEVGCKMQSILLSGLRAPDAPTQATKKCVRWLRGRCQLDADPQKQSYMQNVSMSCELIDAAMDECEYLPVHYVHHLADAFAVVAYHHPDERVREHAYYLHQQVAVELFHFKPESREEFISRHQDRPWRDVAILEAQPRAIPISPEADHPQKSMRMVGEPLGCVCEMKDRDWNPDTGVCATCGNRFRDFAQGLRSQGKLEVLDGVLEKLDSEEEKVTAVEQNPTAVHTFSPYNHMVDRCRLCGLSLADHP